MMTYEQIKQITTGAIRTEQCEDGIHFYKCTERQLEAWKSMSEVFYNRALATTGVRLDFHTNSKKLSFRAVTGDKFDIYIDNLFKKQYVVTETNTEISIDITDIFGEKTDEVRVTVYFPSHSVGIIKNLTLDDNSTITPHIFNKKILLLCPVLIFS
jgi:hypothetical protein